MPWDLYERVYAAIVKKVAARVPNTNLYICNLSPETDRHHLQQAFAKYGRVINIRMLPPTPGGERTAAFVRMATFSAAKRAVRRLDNRCLPHNRKWLAYVRFARDTDHNNRRAKYYVAHEYRNTFEELIELYPRDSTYGQALIHNAVYELLGEETGTCDVDEVYLALKTLVNNLQDLSEKKESPQQYPEDSFDAKSSPEPNPSHEAKDQGESHEEEVEGTPGDGGDVLTSSDDALPFTPESSEEGEIKGKEEAQIPFPVPQFVSPWLPALHPSFGWAYVPAEEAWYRFGLPGPVYLAVPFVPFASPLSS
jgi:hypothetical protein